MIGTSGLTGVVIYCEVTQPFPSAPWGYRICHQLSPGSLPTISTLMSGGIIPSTLLDVDGSARTLTWVEVIPSTGGTVSWIEGEDSAVSDGRGMGEAVIVDMAINAVGEGVPCS